MGIIFKKKLSMKEIEKNNDTLSMKGILINRLLTSVMYTFVFFVIYSSLIEYDNVAYQSIKDRYNMIAMFSFSLFLLVSHKTKFVHKQSLVISIIFAFLATVQSVVYIKYAPDLIITVIFSKVIIWICLMIAVDMIVGKKVRIVEQMNIPLLLLFVMLTFLMISQRNGKYEVLNYLLVLICVFIPIEKEEWSRILKCLFIAGIATFFIKVVVSEITNPYGLGERWYGCFTNIGAFGEFIGLVTSVSIVLIVYSKKSYTRKSIQYILSWLLLGAVLVVASLNGTTTYVMGFVAVLLVLFIFGKEQSFLPNIFIKLMVVISLAIFSFIGFLYYVQLTCHYSGGKMFLDNSLGQSFFPIAFPGIYKIIYKATSFSDAVNGERADFIQSSAVTFLHVFSSTRIGIFAKYLRETSFVNNSGGEWYHGYFAPGAHSQYIQILYEYGFLVGGLNILLFIGGWISSIIGWVKKKDFIYFVTMIVLSMTLGIWTGEVCAITYPISFISLFLIGRMIVDSPFDNSISIKGILTDLSKRKILLLSLIPIIGMVFAVIKLGYMNKEDSRGCERYIVLADCNADSENVNNFNSGIVIDQSYAIDNEISASWGDCGYIVIPFEGVNQGDELKLNINVTTENEEQIEMKVCYEDQTKKILVNNLDEHYSLLFDGWPEENNIVFIVKGNETLNSPVIISDIVLVNNGK